MAPQGSEPTDAITQVLSRELSRRRFLKVSAFVGSSASLALILQACGAASSGSPAGDVATPGTSASASAGSGGASATPDTTPVHLTLGSYTWGTIEQVWASQIAAYMVKYPNVTVDTQFGDFSGFMDKLTTEIAAGTPPDIAMVIPDLLPTYYAQGLLLDLEPYMGAVDQTAWYPQAWEGLSFGPDKHHFGVPLTFDTVGCLWYNKDLFDQAGMKYPDETWTYDDLVSNAAKLTTRGSGGQTTQWGLGIGWEPWYQFMKMFGVEPWDQQNFSKSNFDSPEAISAIQKAADLYVKHKVSPVQPANSGLAVTGADVQFTAGKMAMLLGGSWNAQTYLDPEGGIKTFKFDMTYVPLAAAGAPRKSVGQDNIFVIFKSTKNPDAAWQFIQDNVLSQKAQEDLGSAVEIPAMKVAAQNTYQKNWLDKLEHGYIQLDQMDKYTDNVQFGLLVENTWMVEVDNQLDAVWKGADVAATCQSIASTLNGLLARAKEKYPNS